MGVVKTSAGDSTHRDAEGRIDAYEVTARTNPQGVATARVEFAKPFGEAPRLYVSANHGVAGWQSRGTKQATVRVADADANAEVTVTVLAIGA